MFRRRRSVLLKPRVTLGALAFLGHVVPAFVVPIRRKPRRMGPAQSWRRKGGLPPHASGSLRRVGTTKACSMGAPILGGLRGAEAPLFHEALSGRFPTTALGRMEAAANFVRQRMEGRDVDRNIDASKR